MSVALGIDLGTSNSVAAVATANGVEFIVAPNGERIHPSVLALPRAGGVVVGADAKLFRLTEPENVISSAKRFIGQNFRSPVVQLALTGVPYKIEEGPNQQAIAIINGRRMTMSEVGGQILLNIKRSAEMQLGDRVDQAVITVPANFTDAQRQATKEAGRLAGLEVLRLINEPTAAALAYGFGQRGDERVVVFDFGGGTLDVSVLRISGEVIEVLSSDGDFFLGGDDIDRSVTEFLAAEFNRKHNLDPRQHPGLMTKLAMGAEAIKIHLSDYASAEGNIDELDLPNGRIVSLPFALSRREFETMTSGYVNRAITVAKQAMAAARLSPKDISRVLCVGGSTRIPLVRNRLAETFGKAPDVSLNPDQVVAHGAALQAGSLTGALSDPLAPARAGATFEALGAGGGFGGMGNAGAMPRPLLLDVNPSSLSIQTAGGFTEVLIEKNAPIPIERTKAFSTLRDEQTSVTIDCCRGEARRYSDNEQLGQLLLEGLPPKKRGELKIEVTFRCDADGILHVRARDGESGAEQRARLTVLGAPTAPSEGLG